MRLQCGNCGHIWEYNGKRTYYATCPNCLYKVNLAKQTDPWDWAHKIASASVAERPSVSSIYSDFLNLMVFREKRMSLAKTVAEKIVAKCSEHDIDIKSNHNKIVVVRPGCPLFADAVSQFLGWDLAFVWAEDDVFHKLEKGHMSDNLDESGVKAFIVEMISENAKQVIKAIDILRQQGINVEGVFIFLQLFGSAEADYEEMNVPLVSCFVCTEEGVMRT